MNNLDLDFSGERKPVKCKHCRYTRGEHHAKDLLCPAGMRTRIGHLQFGPTSYEPREDK